MKQIAKMRENNAIKSENYHKFISNEPLIATCILSLLQSRRIIF
jgi:hypothetical protein